MEDNDDVPSPPPFYRVSGHFTVLNPSRPMALAKLMEAATLVQGSTALSSSTTTPALDVPDLIGDATSSQSDSTKGEWPRLEQFRSYAAAFPPQENFGVRMTTTLAKNNDSESILAKRIDENVQALAMPRQISNASLRTIETPEGTALLLHSYNHQGVAGDADNPRRHARWTPEEDELLRAAVELEEGPPHNWKKIAKKYFRDSRNALACKGRWNKSLQPGLVHEKWSPEEDKVVLEGHQNALSWPEISDMLAGRTPESIRNHFLNEIDPSLDRSPFTESERRRVYELQAQYGNKWTQIASEMPGRSEKMVKNFWFNAMMSHRRKIRRLANESK